MKPTFDQPVVWRPSMRDCLRKDRAARRIVRQWRRLTRGARTLVACSGGADSAALALTLAAAAPDQTVIAHVLHDMRPRAQAQADLEAVRDLANWLSVPFISREAHLPSGNPEAGARQVRLRALSEMALEAQCAFVATGHQADDQLETMLMALVRGAGLRGLSGAAPSWKLQSGVTLIRPMLCVTRADAERICGIANYEWRHDHTNEDESRLRNAIRRRVAPELRLLRPAAALRASEAAALVHEANEIVMERVAEVFGDDLAWPRRGLAAQRSIVVGAGLRRAHDRLACGVGADRLPKRRLNQVIEAIRDPQSHERIFHWPGGVRVQVASGLVAMTRVEG